ncbi:MAG: hypothetical protein ACLQNV_20520 [Steroidobacteraceae bacterium]
MITNKNKRERIFPRLPALAPTGTRFDIADTVARDKYGRPTGSAGNLHAPQSFWGIGERQSFLDRWRARDYWPF